ncbi:MAG: single-stranded DNA-binding protein [Acetatifactor sp.]|nr:single-stranded DNA-binding protein [Acetatifactor sp.]
MNKVILIGRLTRDPEVRYTSGENPTAIARYTLAIDRKFKKDGEPSADFINCVAFGKNGEFAEKYLRKGVKIAMVGRIQTGSYTNKDGQKVYTTDVVVEEHEFAESKNASGENSGSNGGGYIGQQSGSVNEGFMNIPDGIDEELPFN